MSSSINSIKFTGFWRAVVVSVLGFLSSLFILLPAVAEEIEWDKRITYGTLPNGFSYYLYDSNKKDDPFNIRLIVHAGSVDERKPSGVAHIVEHMVFQSTKSHPETLHRYFVNVGWRTGLQVSAVTRETETQFMVRTRPEDSLGIDASLAFIADMAFGAQLRDEDWQIERSVILQEFALGDQVAERLNRQKKELLRIGSRFVGRPTIGTEDTIKNTTIADMREFYDRFYTASNMSLVVSGRIDKAEVEAAIVKLFGSAPKKPAPDRSYVTLPLSDGIKLGLVQDEQGTTSQVTYALRTAMPPRASDDGQFAYMQKYLLSKLIRKRIMELAPHYAPVIENLSFVAQETTEERLILAFSARTHRHNAALNDLFEVLERLRREGLDSAAVQKEIAAALKINENNIEASTSRTFAEWEDKITSAILMKSVLADPRDRAHRTRELLERVTPEILNDTLRQMLDAPDQIVLFRAPGDMSLTPPSVEEITMRRDQVSGLDALPALAAANKDQDTSIASAVPVPVWPDEKKPLRNGHIEFENHIENSAIDEWTLSNGDKVVWLARDNPDGKIYLSGQSSPGFHNAEFGSAVSQAAVQLWAQSGYNFWSQAGYDVWRNAQPSRWSFELKGGALDVAAAVKPENLSQLLDAYASTISFGLVRPEALNSLRPQMDEARPDDYEQLIYGEEGGTSGVEKLRGATLAQLEDAAKRLLDQPVTWFIVGPTPSDDNRDAFAQVIGAIPRKSSLKADAPLQRAGIYNATVKTMPEGRAQVDISFFSEMDWTPEKAFMVSTLTPVAQQALKDELRLKLGAIYRMQFDLRLDPETNRVIGNLSFNCAPERTEELKSASLAVLKVMPDVVQKANLDRIRADVAFAELGKREDPNLWLRRMMLSYKRYGDARYLQTMESLGDKLSLTVLQAEARKIFNTENIATLIRLPENTNF